VEAFKEKIDFAAQKKELKRINSPYLCEQNTGIRPPEAKPITSFIPPEGITIQDAAAQWGVILQNQPTQVDGEIRQQEWVDLLLKDTSSSSDDDDMHLS